jgi:hypothetical protein
VTYETALAASSNPADFELQMRTLRRRSRVVTTGDVPPAGFTDGMSDIVPGQ